MLDFLQIKTALKKDSFTKEEYVTVYPNLLVARSKDLMVRAKGFYAIWNEEKNLWSTDEYDVPHLVDKALWEYRNENFPKDADVRVQTFRNADSDQWMKFRRYMASLSDNDIPLDETVIFADQEVKRDDYASMKLDYPMVKGDITAWDKIISTLYSPEERDKIEWSIGSIINGDSKRIEKFMVMYGRPGTGKSTILKIIEMLFGGYVATFDAKSLGSRSNQFATSMFASNPLIAVQQDGDLSKLEDNTLINTIVSHENIAINEKNKPIYTAKINAFLFMGTNSPVKISDSRSGLIRRLILVSPTGHLIPGQEYQRLITQVPFELGAIAYHCLKRYEELGFHYYDNYRPTEMMYQTDDILEFFMENYETFKGQECTSLKQAYDMYLQFCQEANIQHPIARKFFKREMSSYFEEFHDRFRTTDGTKIRSVYTGFQMDMLFPTSKGPVEKPDNWIELDEQPSSFDKENGELLAQYATDEGTPKQKWVNVTTHLSDLDTSKLHYVKVPDNHIVIDFDLKDDEGEKSLERNLEEASKLPPTYAEVSKSGGGLHLHYIYDGDVSQLSNVYSEGVEIKVYTGGSSLRRRLSKCTNQEVSHIASGLPLKDVKDSNMIDVKAVRSEKALRDLVERNLRKEIHPGTNPSVHFIAKILDDAYDSGLKYNLTDMRGDISLFAMRSTNHSSECLKLVNKMKFEGKPQDDAPDQDENADVVFYDVEVYPNLFLVGWKYAGEGKTFTPMINPTPQEIEELFKYKLVGFYNRQYDNHILWAAYLGYSTQELFELSCRMVGDGDHTAKFGEAYGLAYADIYDISTKKQSLKKWEIELGITHMEMDIPWDKPVSEEDIPRVIEYNKNDVLATEALWNARFGDVSARMALSKLSGLPVNNPTRKHAERIIFGNDRNPERQFHYTHLATGEVE